MRPRRGLDRVRSARIAPALGSALVLILAGCLGSPTSPTDIG